ncbi:MAG: hypothetical protein JXP34_29130, partial [Planctomycetes bacterium]|nr:hypothetical protein [Planctomycetota bacterium]
LARGIVPIAIGTTLAASYAKWRAACGDGPARVLWSTLAFLVVTPCAPGLLRIFPAALLTFFSAGLLPPVIAVLYPFAALGAVAGYGWLNVAGIILPLVAVPSLLASGCFLRLASARIRRLATASPGMARRERYRHGEEAERERKQILRDLVAGSGRDADPRAGSDALPLISRLMLARARGIEARAYRWSGRNPLVAREIVRASHGADPEDAFYGWIISKLGIPFAVLIVLAVVLIIFGEGPGASRGVQVILVIALAGAILAWMQIACGAGARLLPTETAGGLRDILASTPLRGSEAVAGGLVAAALRGRGAAAAAGIVIAVLAWARLQPLWLPGALLLTFALGALGYGAALWMRALIAKPGQAMGASLGGLVALGVGSLLVMPGDWAAGAWHPLAVLFDAHRGGEWRVFPAALAIATIAAVLIASFALTFDRILGRPRTRAGRTGGEEAT